MTRSRKNIIFFVITVVLGCGMLLVCSAQSADDGTELENMESESNSLFGNDPDFTKNTNNGSGLRELIFRFMVSVLFLIALVVGGIYISKRFLPKILMS